MSDDPRQSDLAERFRAAAPPMAIDLDEVLRVAKGRRTRRRLATGALACAMVGAGLVVPALLSGATTSDVAETAKEAADMTEGQDPRSALLELADDLEEHVQPIPDDMAWRTVSLDWDVLSDGRVRIGETERTEYPDGTVRQTESSAGPSASLDVGDPLPADADVTQSGPMSQSQPSWLRNQELPLDPHELRAAWVQDCLRPSVGATEYRCVYVGVQETLPIASDELAVAVLRVLVAEPEVRIERIIDLLGRDVVAASFDLPGEGTTSYLIDPSSGQIIGMQLAPEPALGGQLGTDEAVSLMVAEWITPPE